MTGLVRAELLKVRTTRVVYGLLGAAVVLTLLVVVGTIVSAPSGDTVELADLVRTGFVGIIGLVLGILSATTEFRHRTANVTFLVTPARRRVLVAKVLAMAAVGVALALVSIAVAVVFGVPLAGAQGVEVSLDEPLRPLLGVVIDTALWAVLGVGVGALVRNQVLAIVGSLVYVFVVESILSFNIGEVARYLVSAASQAVLGGEQTAPDVDVLGFAAGVAVFLVWVGVCNLLGWLRTERSDIAGE